MIAKILDGRKIAAEIRQQIKIEIKQLGITPGLAVILVGNDPASHLYVNLKEKACYEVGIPITKYLFSETESQEKIIGTIKNLNENENIHAILVQLPLPQNFAEDEVIGAIDPKKDVDGFHKVNLQQTISGNPSIIPGVALGIMCLIEEAEHTLAGKKALLLVNSTTFAIPIKYLLEMQGVKVEIKIAPEDLASIQTELSNSDILVVAIGRPQAIQKEMIKEGSIIIDVGTNKLPNGTVVGDADYTSVAEKTGAITPVPGGVGPMTVAMLLQNVVKLAKQNIS